MRSERRPVELVRALTLSAITVLFAQALAGQSFLISDGASWSTCAGTFYDSGGAGGDYDNNEDFTATICPGGGPGGGGAIAVHFLSFEAEHSDDQLVIHNGTSTGASILATGTENNSLGGQTFTATGPSGCLTFHWISDNPANAAGWMAEVSTGSDAGADASLTVCSGQASFPLLGALGGNPDAGGSWNGPQGPHGPQYDPATDPGGVYTYTVGGSSCGDLATVTITNAPGPDAGEDGALQICEQNSPVALINSLGGAPQSGGTWTGPNGPHTGTLDPATDAPGNYTYTVTGTSPCPNASATVTVAITGPDAGVDASLAVCSGQATVVLLDALGGNPDAGGSWTGPGGPHGPPYDPANDPGGTYTYTVSAGSCTDVATLTITNSPGPDAGGNGTLQICEQSSPVVLTNSLGGTPQSGGTWTGPNGSHDGSFDPTTDAPGDYTYTLAGTPPCLSASATVTVAITGPDAGVDASLSVCSGQATVVLLDALGGDPDADGSWTGPGGPHGAQYDPANDPGGTYTYTVSAGSCTDVATLTITNSPGPDAGGNGALQICEQSSPVALINSLAGAPQSSGTWAGPNGPHDGSYDPTTDAPGDYTYTVVGTPPCPNVSATVTVVITGPDAGADAILTVCSGQAAFPLLEALGGSPDVGGSWTGPGGPHGSQYDPASEPGGVYTYTVMGGSCTDVATVTMTNVPGADAGADGTLLICDQSSPVELINELEGTPQNGGSWSGPNGQHDGSYDPATDAPGDYTYTVVGSPPCPNASATVTVVITGPDAGADASLSVCSGQSAFLLIDALGGSPNSGGAWTGPGGPHGSQYDPGSEPSGVYIYTVTAGSCTDVATITITNTPGPDAGEDGSLQICEQSSPVVLTNSLGGAPQSGGTWSGPNGPHDGSYDPATDAPGDYTYTVTGSSPCLNASATVTVVITGPDAGADADLSVCSGQPTFPLINALGGVPDAGGWWTGPGGPHGSLYDPGTEPGGVYTYTVMAGSCPDVATVTITNLPGPDAGENGTLLICELSPPVNLINSLDGTPQAGGTWTGPNGPHDGSYDPATDAAGDYTYTVTGSSPCPNASATVTVVITGPDAGADASLTVCSGQSSFLLFDALNGSPDVGGAWTGPAGPHGTQYDPGIDPGGVYTYIVLDGSLCADSATVTINNIPGPDAGEDGTLLICELSPPANLISSLGGAPDPGGSWAGPNGPHDGSYDPATDVAGAYTYTVAGILPCPFASATVTVISSGSPDAGSDGELVACDTMAALDLFAGLGGTPDANGIWEDLNASGALSNGTLNTNGLPAGMYGFLYTVVVAGCGTDQAQVNVQVVDGIEAAGLVRVCDQLAGTSILSFTLTGGDPATYAVNGVPGTLETSEPFLFTSEPLPDSLEFTIVVSDQSGCSSLHLVVEPCSYHVHLFIPESFSPNGDGINDHFLIPGLEDLPGNEIHIFNRWGAELFHAKDYHLTMPWDGSAARAAWGTGSLPTGTYYYVLDLGNGADPVKGFIYLNK